jgi:hypothetical protein
VNIATVKQQARELERQGKTAAALDAYEEIIARLECDAIEPEAPLYVKVGDLSLKSGDKLGAIAMFERAAEQYAKQGSNRSVIALCLKILRTAPHRNDVYIRFAQQLLNHGYVEPTRLVLVDYAERAKLPKTLNTLQRLAVRPESEIRVMLERFFETAERGQHLAGHTGEMPAVMLPADAIPQTAPRPPLVETPRSAARETPSRPAPAPTPEQTGAVPVRDPVMAEIQRPAPRAVEPPAVAPVAPTRRPEQKPRPTRPEPAVPRLGLVARIRRKWGTRSMWVYPAAAAAAVAFLGLGFFAFGALPFGGDLGAEQPGVTVPHTTPSRNTLMMVAAFGATESEQRTVNRTSVATPVQAPVVGTPANQDSTAGVGLKERAPLVPVALDPTAMAAATQAAMRAQPGTVDIPLDNSFDDVGRIAIPTTLPAASELVSRASAAARSTASEPMVAITDLEVAAVARGPDSYQVVQRLTNGEQVSLSVVPFADAPEGESGKLRIKVSGDTAVGTVRFRNSFVTAYARIAPATLEQLLGTLTERSGTAGK